MSFRVDGTCISGTESWVILFAYLKGSTMRMDCQIRWYQHARCGEPRCVMRTSQRWRCHYSPLKLLILASLWRRAATSNTCISMAKMQTYAASIADICTQRREKQCAQHTHLSGLHTTSTYRSRWYLRSQLRDLCVLENISQWYCNIFGTLERPIFAHLLERAFHSGTYISMVSDHIASSKAIGTCTQFSEISCLRNSTLNCDPVIRRDWSCRY